MNKTLVAIAVSAVLAAPAAAYAENDVMFGGGIGVASAAGVSVTGFTLGVQMKLTDSGAVALDYAEGDLFSGTYRGYINNYADGVFWEAGILTGGGATAGLVGAGYDIAQSKNIVFRVRGGAIFDSAGTAFAAAITANYVP
ncbi:MAG: hypothetical protein ACC641_01505 [Acidiferrobacterales bacterium]